MPNTIFSSEGALLFIMFATVALGFWLQRFKAFKTLGPALTVIVMGIVMSNLRIVPTSSATYDAISSYCVTEGEPLASNSTTFPSVSSSWANMPSKTFF